MSAMEDRDFEETRAQCRLPQMDIGIVHRRARKGDRDSLAVYVEIVPFGQRLDRLFTFGDPFRFWVQLTQAAWKPWLQVLNAPAVEAADVPRLPPATKKLRLSSAAKKRGRKKAH